MSSDTSSSGHRLAEIVAVFLETAACGQPPDREQLLLAHPDLAKDLRAFFADHDRMTQAAAPVRAALDDDAARTSAPAENFPQSFGDYELLEEIGRGGMGVVYKGRQISLNRIVALKRIRAGQLASADEVARFRREAEAAAGLDQPHIVPILEVGEHQGQHFFTMKLIEGGNLNAHLAEYAADAKATASLMIAIARAVHHAHQRGILHRDLKPGNILIDAAGTPHVSDFGLAQPIEKEAKLTQSGAIVGTAETMAPEQARGEKGLTTAADVYGLGAILYVLLTGRPPFQGDYNWQTLKKVVEEEPPSPRSINRKANRDLETISLKCLAKQPAQRYGSAELLAEDLERWLHGLPIQARPASVRERMWKWIKRHPAAAALLAVSATAILLVYGGGSVLLRQLQEALAEANSRGKRLEVQRQDLQEKGQALTIALADLGTERDRLAKEQVNLEQTVYKSQLEQAQRELANRNPARARELLERCQWNLRGWEHDYLFGLTKAPPEITAKEALESLRGEDAVITGVAALEDRPFGFLRAGYLGGHEGEPGLLFLNSKVPEAGGWEVRHVPPLAAHAGKVTAMDLNRAGNLVATASADGTIKLWRPIAQSIEEMNTIAFDFKAVKSDEDMVSLAVSPDGRHAAAAGMISGDKGTYHLRVLNLETGKEVVKADWDKPWPAFPQRRSPPPPRVTFGTSHYLLWGDKVIDLRTGEMILEADNRTATFSLDGKTLISVKTGAAGKCVVTFVNIETRAVVRTLESDLTLPLADSTLTSGAVIVVRDKIVVHTFNVDSRNASSMSTLVLLDAKSGKVFRDLNKPALFPGLAAVQASADGRLLYATSWTSIYIWETATGRFLPSVSLGGSSPMSAPDGQRAITFSGYPHTNLTVVDLPSGSRCAALSSPERGRAWAQSTDGTHVVIWNGRSLTRYRIPRGYEERVLNNKAGVHAVKFSPDGTKLASGGADGTVTIWDVERGMRQVDLKGHNGAVYAVAFDGDAKHLFSGGEDKLVRLWDLGTGKESRRFAGHEGVIRSLAFSAQHGHLFSAGMDGSVRLWDTLGAQLLCQREHVGAVYSLACSPDGQHFLSGGADGKLRLWDARFGNLTKVISVHEGALHAVGFSDKGNWLLAGGKGGDATAWDPKTGKRIRRYPLPSTCSYSPPKADGTLILIGGEDLRLWNRSTGKVRVLRTQGRFESAVLSPDGKFVAVPWSDQITIISTDTAAEVLTIRNYRGGPLSHGCDYVFFSPNGKYLAAIGQHPHGREGVQDDGALIFSTSDGKLVATVEKAAGRFRGFIPNSDSVCFHSMSRDDTHSLSFHSCRGGARYKKIDIGRHSPWPLSADGRHVVTTGEEGPDLFHRHVWNIESGIKTATLENCFGEIDFLPGEDRLVSWAPAERLDGGQIKGPWTIQVWNSKTGHSLLTLVVESEVQAELVLQQSKRGMLALDWPSRHGAAPYRPRPLAFWDAPEPMHGKHLPERVELARLAANGKDVFGAGHFISVFDGVTGKPRFRVPRISEALAMAPSRDGTQMLLGLRRGWELRNAATGAVVATEFFEHDVRDVAWSSAQDRFMLWTSSGVVEVWETKPMKHLLHRKFEPDAKRTKSGVEPYPCAFALSPDGHRLVMASGHRLSLMAAASGEQEAAVVLDNPLAGLAFSPDGKRLALISETGEIFITDAALKANRQLLFKGAGLFPDRRMLAFSPDGKRLAVQFEGHIKIWSFGAPDKLLSIEHRGGLNGDLAFSADGARILALRENVLRAWDVTTGLPAVNLAPPP